MQFLDAKAGNVIATAVGTMGKHFRDGLNVYMTWQATLFRWMADRGWVVVMGDVLHPELYKEIIECTVFSFFLRLFHQEGLLLVALTSTQVPLAWYHEDAFQLEKNNDI